MGFNRKRTGCLLISVVGLLPLLIAVCVQTAEAGDEDLLRLEDLVRFNLMTLSDELRETAEVVHYNRQYYASSEDLASYRENVLTRASASREGYKTNLLPDHVFTTIGGGSALYGLCALYLPESSDTYAEEHRYFRFYWPHEKPPDIARDDKYLTDLAALFEVYPALRGAESIKQIACVVFYLFYWDYLYGPGRFSFGDIAEGIFVTTDPSNIITTPEYIALRKEESRLIPNTTAESIGVLPKGGLVKGESGDYHYQVYTWDPGTRYLLMWLFIRDSHKGLFIKEIVIGYL